MRCTRAGTSPLPSTSADRAGRAPPWRARPPTTTSFGGPRALRFTQSDQPSRPERERSRLGKEAYDLAERAIAVNPNDVAGHYWAALGIGSYAEGMGALRALANGIEGKFRRPLERATALDVTYDHGNVPVIWAAYHLELPWPTAATAPSRPEETEAGSHRDQSGESSGAPLSGPHRRPMRGRRAEACCRSPSRDPQPRTSTDQPSAPEEQRVKQEAAELSKTLAETSR